MERTAILIHGCHLQADLNGSPWESIAFGLDADGNPTLNGRVVMGLKTVIEFAAEMVVFSTGASERDGVKEGEFTLQTVHRLNEESNILAETTGFISQDALSGWLDRFAQLDLVSQNTAEECRLNFALCAERGFDRVVLVSSPWHIQRCHTEALKVAQDMRSRGEKVPIIVAVASYGSTEDVVILEPPHRGDMPKTNWHILGRKLFRIREHRRVSFEDRLRELFLDYGV